jgi:hypothetical protein
MRRGKGVNIAEIDVANVVAAFAAVSALVLSVHTLRRQNAIERAAYMTLALTLDRVDEHRLIARTSLENRSPTPKDIDVVRLLVCPQAEFPEAACNALINDASETVKHLRDIGRLELEETLQDGQRILMPLLYYTKENSEVGDELLTYDAVLDVADLQPGTVYAVRMLLYGPERLHRVVHRAFIR